MTTLIPAVDTKYTGTLNLTAEYGYDTRYGRLKAIRYPTNLSGALGELIVLKYDGRGYQLGEAALNADYTEGTRYRQVQKMSERGQVIDQLLGRCVTEKGEYDPSTGVVLDLTATRMIGPVCPAPADGSSLVRSGEYRYDRFLNLVHQKKNVPSSQTAPPKQVEERYGYDELQRLRSAGRCEGAGCAPGAAQTDRYAYDDLGNLTSKSDFGTLYEYGTSARSIGLAGPHAVRRVTKTDGTVATFDYDWNGNLGTGDGRTVEFDEQDRPVRVITGGATSEFKYGPGGGRYVQKVTGSVPPGFGPKTVYYVDKDFELTVWDAGSSQAGRVEERAFVGGSAVVLTSQSGGTATRAVLYRHADRLGSVEAVTKEDGSEVYVDAHGFDPWGKPRGRAWEPTGDRLHLGGEAGAESTRGFTGHEQLDVHYLTHMNGRVYDYRLGRFLSVDPIISDPANPQSINPYSYIGNNPLSGVDPTGYQAAASDSSKHTKLKFKTLAELRREGSIAGRGTTGSQFSSGGVDHDVARMAERNEEAHSSSGNGAAPQGGQSSTASLNEQGSPQETDKPGAAGQAGAATDRAVVDIDYVGARAGTPGAVSLRSIESQLGLPAGALGDVGVGEIGTIETPVGGSEGKPGNASTGQSGAFGVSGARLPTISGGGARSPLVRRIVVGALSGGARRALVSVAKSLPVSFAAQVTALETSVSLSGGLVVTKTGEVFIPAVWRGVLVGSNASSVGRALMRGGLVGIAAGIGFQLELYAHDRAVESLTADIYTVLGRSRQW